MLHAHSPETHGVRNAAGAGATLAPLESQRPRPATTNQMRPQTAASPTCGLGTQHAAPPSHPEALDPRNKRRLCGLLSGVQAVCPAGHDGDPTGRRPLHRVSWLPRPHETRALLASPQRLQSEGHGCPPSAAGAVGHLDKTPAGEAVPLHLGSDGRSPQQPQGKTSCDPLSMV